MLPDIPPLTKNLHMLKLRKSNASWSSPMKKKVTFSADEYNEVWTFVASEIPSEELWFSYKDLQVIKAETRKEARGWRKMEFDKLLNNAFNRDESNRDDRLMQYDQQFLLNTFCALDGMLYQRGLERYCSQTLGEERSDAKSRSRYAVLELQRQYKCSCASGCAHFEQMSKAISAKYIQICADATLFARRMAIGDENALTAPQSSEQLQHILNMCRSPKQLRRMSNYSVSTASSAGSSFDSRLVAINRDERRLIEQVTFRDPAKVPRKTPWHDAKELYAAIA